MWNMCVKIALCGKVFDTYLLFEIHVICNNEIYPYFTCHMGIKGMKNLNSKLTINKKYGHMDLHIQFQIFIKASYLS